MSGWSTFKMTILAARRVVPPDLIELATPSAPFMKDTGPDDVPPLESGSREERKLERLIPEPEPYLKIQPSFLYQSRMDCILSSTERMKQALHCGFSCTPTLNQTGLLKAAYWFIKSQVKSWLKFSPSSGEAK